MALPSFTMRQLLEAGVHFGHRTGRWNPKMAPFIFGQRRKIHVIDLQQTVPLLYRALSAVRDTVAGGGRVLFVGTKRQATEKIAEAAKRCGQHYVNHRWLGGMMTNWKTISVSMRRLKELEEQLGEDEENLGLTKKELLRLTRARDKLHRALGGIKEMGGLPDILFVIDTNKEHIAVSEANKLGIPVIAVVDTNSDPAGIAHPIPGNDDAVRSINLYCDLMADAVLDGIQQEMLAAGIDVGEGEEAPAEQLDAAPEKAPATAPAETTPAAPQPDAAPAGAADPAPATAEPDAASVSEPAKAPAAKPTQEAPAVAADGEAKTASAPAEEAKAPAKKKPAAKPEPQKTDAEAKTETKTKSKTSKAADDKKDDNKEAAAEASQSDDTKKPEKKPAADEESEKSVAKEKEDS